MSILPERFTVTILIEKDKPILLNARRPSKQFIDQNKQPSRSNFLIKINKNQLLLNSQESNKIVLPKQIITGSSRGQLKSAVDEESMNDMAEDFNQFDIDIQDPDDPEVDDDFNEEDDDIEDLQISMSSGDNKKMTKRQFNAFNNISQEPLYQLQDKKLKIKNKIILTDEEIRRKNLKEMERKQKLLKQQEEFKQQTVHKILNEVGKKQKQRQEQELKETQKKQHIYRSLPAGDLVIKYISTQSGERVIIHPFLTAKNVYALPTNKPIENSSKIISLCNNCQNTSKYRIPRINKNACGLECYRQIISY